MASHKVTLSPNLNQRVLDYAEAHDNMSPLDAIRELLTMGLSVSPLDDITMVSKQRGFNDVRRWAFNELSISLEDMAKKARAQIGNYSKEPT